MRSGLILVLAATALSAQDAREIIRRSIELDQVNWLRMKDYTWIAHDVERHLDSNGQVKSEEKSSWETLVLYGEPYRRMLERDSKPLPPNEERKEKQKLDKLTAKLERETPEQRKRRIEDYEKERRKDRDFLREIPDLYDFHLEGETKIDGREVWVIAATPRSGFQPKRRDARPLLRIKGKLWVDKAEYQWVRLEAETTDTISYGLFLARLNAGARLIFEQTRVNDEVWLPKREWVRGTGRIGLLKKVAMEEEITWSNYRKFSAESKIVPAQ